MTMTYPFPVLEDEFKGKKVLVTGGMNRVGYLLRNAELNDPATGMWTATGLMTRHREFHTATLLRSGMVLVGGGFKKRESRAAEL